MAQSEANRSKPPESSAESHRAGTSRPRRTRSQAASRAVIQPAAAQATPAGAPLVNAPVAALAGATDGPAAAGHGANKRFDIFLVDVGWTSHVAESLRKNVEICLRYNANAMIYVLNREQCVRLFHNHPSMIGTEPSVIIIDRDAHAAKRRQGFGFKVNFGLIRDVATANNLLKWVLAVLAEQKPGSDITEPIRTVIHKEGLRGAIDILADIAHSPAGEAMTH